MAKVVKLTEKDIQALVERMVSEGDDNVSSSDLGKSTVDAGKEMKKGGLAPKERETLNQAISMLTNFFKQPGNQATGKAYSLFNRLKGELGSVEPEGEVNESLPRRERERQETNYRKSSFEPYEREGQLMDIFGPYKQDVPPNVIQYMRKNPALIIKRMEQVYGRDKILQYLGITE
jgi:hypothetical protein